MGHDLRPRDPRRLTLLSDVKAAYDERGLLRITVSYTYDEWCCDGVHEVVDALAAITTALEDWQERNDRADRERLRQELGLDDL